MATATRRGFDPLELTGEADPARRNRVLFDWICDDQDRASLYTWLQQRGNASPYPFHSRARFELDPAPLKDDHGAVSGSKVYLVWERSQIEHILQNTDTYGNLPYADIGSGGFMLGLDPDANQDLHGKQREALKAVLEPWQAETSRASLQAPCELAVREASVMALRNRHFDLADFAEQAALRFCIRLFGFSSADHALLEETLRKAYRGMNYQMLGRHFLYEPLTLPASREALGRLATRVAQLMDDYHHVARYPRWDERPNDPRSAQRTLPEGVEPLSDVGLSCPEPIIPALANYFPPRTVPPAAQPELTFQERAIVVSGTLPGIVANIQASVCIAMDYILADPKRQIRCLQALRNGNSGALQDAIKEALHLNPPAPYLPRRVRDGCNDVQLGGQTLHAGDELILLLGAGTRTAPAAGCPSGRGHWGEDRLVFGLTPGPAGASAPSPHWCPGDILARTLIEEILRQTLLLPGLGRRIDPISGDPMPLEKRWGFACERFPLVYRRDKLRAHQGLNVVMRIKSPQSEHVERIKRVIVSGAPRIEQALRNARHVHFAFFELIDNDTKLVLHTIYDGDFDDYINHFALAVDDLFDRLFPSLEGAPPLPVRDFPREFVETIRRYNVAPVADYLFSAYPRVEVPHVRANQQNGLLP